MPKKVGRPENPAPKKATTFYLSVDVAREFKIFCAKKGVSMSELAEQLFVKAMKSKK